MSYIYKITNEVNDKIYIGKTEFSIEKRFKEHCRDSTKVTTEKRPLYAAMRKYGIDKFHIELIEETSNPDEREIYWIDFYQSYGKNGYNATKGGDGKCLYDYNLILSKLNEGKYACEVAEEIGCCTDVVYYVAKSNNIVLKNRSQDNFRKNKKKEIFAYLKNNEFFMSFNSVADAARWCYENQKCASLNSGVRSHISEAARGIRKSAYGYIWKYEDE